MNVHTKPFYVHENQCMQILNLSSPIHTKFLARKFAIQTSVSTFKTVSLDIKLEHTINGSQKSSGSIRGQTKTESYNSEWELVYHEILAVSNYYNDLTKSKTHMGPSLDHDFENTLEINYLKIVILHGKIFVLFSQFIFFILTCFQHAHNVNKNILN